MVTSQQVTPAQRGAVRVEPGPKRVRAYLGGHLVADTLRPALVWEVPYYPAYYFPAEDVVAELVETGEVSHSPSRGDASHYDVTVGDVTAPGAAQRFLESPIEELRQAVRLDWDAMDEWIEEDEPVYTHPRDPHTRVDILASSRHVGRRRRRDRRRLRPAPDPVRDRPAAAVLPPAHRRPAGPAPALGHPVALPLQGHGQLLVARTRATRSHEDLVWIYRSPLPESQKIAGLACFYNEKVDISLDGVLQQRPHSPFS